ncbi:MAG TPA: glycosyltransferase family 39 protein [Polyangiaceae bacterium]|jgi:hypothetical protein|nr:glycosyltransferase family 39 protein [Polyangiaceae bacterium]
MKIADRFCSRTYLTQIRDPKVLVGVAILGALTIGVRVLGLDYARGLPLHWDEPYVMRVVSKLVRESPTPVSFWSYPPALANIIAWVAKGVGRADSPSSVVRVAHCVVVSLGVASALLSGFATTLLRGYRAGLFTLWIAALSPLWVEQTRYVTTDVPTAFGTALVVCVYCRISITPRIRELMLAGAAVGIAAAFKYIGALSAVLVVAAVIVSPGARSRRVWLGLIAGGAVAIITFVGLNYQILSAFPLVLKALKGEFGHYATVHPGYSPPHVWLYVLKYVALYGLGVAGTACALYAFAVNAGHRRDLRLLPILMLAVLWLGFLCTRRVFFARNIVHVLPVLAVLAGVGFDAIWITWGKRGRAMALIAALLTLPMTGQTLQFGWALRETDSRIRASQWMASHLASTDRVAVSPPTPRFFLPIPQSKEIHLSPVGGYKAAKELSGHYDYLVVPFGGITRYLREPDAYRVEVRNFTRWHKALTRLAGPPVAAFDGAKAPGAELPGSTGDCYHNPRIEIYDLRRGRH